MELPLISFLQVDHTELGVRDIPLRQQDVQTAVSIRVCLSLGMGSVGMWGRQGTEQGPFPGAKQTSEPTRGLFRASVKVLGRKVESGKKSTAGCKVEVPGWRAK